MSARKWVGPGLDRCACGKVPGMNIRHAGQTRLYQVSCACGLETEASESHDESVACWNDGEVREAGNAEPARRSDTRRALP